MPRDSNGTYTRAVTPPANGDVASATDFNTEMDDIATAFTGSLTANGSKAWGADQNANGYRLVGLATPASSGHAATKGYVDGAFQPVDATLTAWAALVGSANQIAYWTGTDTFALTGFTAFGRSLVDDVDAAAGRTTLGLGTAATVNTGTSGATIPLLNGANTWSAEQTFSGSDANVATFFRSGAAAKTRWIETTGNNAWGARNNANTLAFDYNGSDLMTLTSAGVLALSGSTVWHAGNDGAGSTMDADLLDGLQGSAYGQLAANQTWSGVNRFSASVLRLDHSGNNTTETREVLADAPDAFGRAGIVFGTTAGGVGSDSYIGFWTNEYGVARAERVRILRNGDVNVLTGTLLAPIRIGSETSGALTSASRNTQVHCSGNITLPASGMTDGDIILIDPRGTARTITRPSAHTMYVNDSDVATATTPAHNLVSAKFCGGSKWVLQGAV